MVDKNVLTAAEFEKYKKNLLFAYRTKMRALEYHFRGEQQQIADDYALQMHDLMHWLDGEIASLKVRVEQPEE